MSLFVTTQISWLNVLFSLYLSWIYWTLAIFSGVCFFIILFTIPETHHPTILKHKAVRKRKETGELRWYAAIERNKVPRSVFLKNILVKPWKVLFSEPMLMAVTVYMSFIYGCLVSNFPANFPSYPPDALLIGCVSISCLSRTPSYSPSQSPLDTDSTSASVDSCSSLSSSVAAFLASWYVQARTLL